MSIPLPLDLLLNQGAVFLHHELEFKETTRTKFIIYLSHPVFPSPLFFVLTTTDKGRKIPDLPKARQDDILVIPPGELEFFTGSDHTFIDLNNHRDIQREKFEIAYNAGVVKYVGRLSQEHLGSLLVKAKNSKILRVAIKRRVLGN